MTVNLADNRWKKSVLKLRKRMEQADKVLEIYEDRPSYTKLRFNALNDFIEEIPELRRLRRKPKR